MAPLLLTALIGVGVKFATDLLVSGAKQAFGPAQTGQAGQPSFSAALDKARGTTGSGAAGASSATSALSAPGAGLADRARVLALDMNGGLPAAQGFATYRRFDASVQAP